MRHLKITLIYIGIVFFSLEVGLRLIGVKVPPKPNTFSNSQTHLPDSLIGWKPNPGQHELVLNKFGHSFTFTVSESNGRITKPMDSSSEKQSIQLIGGSFFFGTGLNDNQTCAWKLQEKFPIENIQNYSIGAQGTYQSLLGLERRLKAGNKPKCVIYGMISNHKKRNVASHDWMEAMHYAKHKITPEIPYVTLDEKGEINREKKTSLTLLPFSDHVVTAYVIQKILNKILTHKREQNADLIFEQLIQKMNVLCKKNNINFYVATLYLEKGESEDLYDFFEQHAIQHINCQVPLTENNTVKDDGHPIETVNEEWFKRISKRLTTDGVLTQTN